MEALRLNKIIEKTGELHLNLNELPCKEGQQVELILLFEKKSTKSKIINYKSTVKCLLNSNIVGLWKNRKDIEDSAEFARSLRNKAQNRGGIL
ncbi:DUF104 domain-containing protein [Candidatus Magnetomoraceae bacterium gMMP-15]